MKRLWQNGVVLGALVLTLVLAACSSGSGGGGGGGSSTDNPPTQTCEDTASCQDASFAVQNTSFLAMSAAFTSTSGGSGSVDNPTFNCMAGGSVTLSGTYSGTSPTISENLTLVFVDCGYNLSPIDIVVNGTVTLTATIDELTSSYDVAITSPSLSVVGTISGTPIDFTCAVDMDWTYDAGGTWSYTSTVCGTTVSASFPVGGT